MKRREILALVLVVLGALTASVGARSALEASERTWERFFHIAWTANTGPTGTVVDGYVESRRAAPAVVRVAVDALATDSRVLTSEFFNVEIAPPSRGYFRKTMPVAANYRVRIVSFVLAVR